MYRVGLFATGRGQGSRGLLEAIHAARVEGRLPIEIAFIFSNRDPGEFEATDSFFSRVRELDYPLVTASFRKYRRESGGNAGWRDGYESLVERLLTPFRADLCVLAGFLLLVPRLSETFPMVNLHPAAPGGPVGMWNDVIWSLIEQRARTSGNTMFKVTPELDKGPCVSYSTFSIRGPGFDSLWDEIGDTPLSELRRRLGEDLPLFHAIRRHGMVRERPLVVETLRAFAEGRLLLTDGAVLGPSGKPIDGMNLSTEIEATVSGVLRPT